MRTKEGINLRQHMDWWPIETCRDTDTVQRSGRLAKVRIAGPKVACYQNRAVLSQ